MFNGKTIRQFLLSCIYLLSVLGVLAISGCGGSGGSGGSSGSDGDVVENEFNTDPTQLDGHWWAIRLRAGLQSSISVTIVDGAINGVPLMYDGPNRFRSVDGDGNDFFILHDMAIEHAAIITNVNATHRTLAYQKGSLPGFQPKWNDQSVIVGNWVGEYFHTDDLFNAVEDGPIDMDMYPDTTFASYNAAGTISTGFLNDWQEDFGLWFGTSQPNETLTGGAVGRANAWMTHDTKFILHVTCIPSLSAFPGGCSYNALSRKP